jgi:hypothetical protein
MEHETSENKPEWEIYVKICYRDAAQSRNEQRKEIIYDMKICINSGYKNVKIQK